MDKLEAIQKLFAAYPNTTATKATFAVYLEVLADVPLVELNAVIMQCLREGSSFPPSAGQVLERWRTLHHATSPDLAAQGWLSVQRAMRDPATYTPEPTSFVPKFTDAITQKAVEALGWYNLRMSENPRTDQAQFERLYRMFAEQEASEQRLSPEFKQLRDEKAIDAQDGERTGIKRIGEVLKLNGGDN